MGFEVFVHFYFLWISAGLGLPKCVFVEVFGIVADFIREKFDAGNFIEI